MFAARPGRLALVFLLALAATAQMWPQNHPRRAKVPAGQLRIELLAGPETDAGSNGVRRLGVWQMTSEDGRFGGYSALVPMPDGRLRAYTDRGSWLEFLPPGDPNAKPAQLFGSIAMPFDKRANDVEGATYDPATGSTWLSLEGINGIWRLGASSKAIAETYPAGMEDFPGNGGAESIVRLPGGRFLVLRETGDPLSPMRRTALLFAGDPIEDNHAVQFIFESPPGLDPVDAAVLPDGCVPVLLRGLTFAGYPPFASRLVVADPADIRAGKPWPWQPVARISDFDLRENYEGLAVMPGGESVRLWLVTDANEAVVVQRTLLVELEWKPKGGQAGVEPGR
ncbi:esterase-like activity of phytase family protein [Altererythrobacter salegens]|uniref:Esterase-like activity of phytase family protein n=1 Tax=Croceibacterium salegens TaxID=1737568 RepID=A0A6I4SWC4_9SPHN|nr:esterase-like activity of phytase family protein [Croceibacterium salegens]MXO60424.1 esterase-like activity of phytase family protein [Croceibacterium salegens]